MTEPLMDRTAARAFAHEMPEGTTTDTDSVELMRALSAQVRR
jgi:hypothetical protein